MNEASWLGIKLYMSTQVLRGLIYTPHEYRLLDLLNGVSVRRLESRGKFLELANVTIDRANGEEEKLVTAYVNKATIQLAATLDSDAARGIGAEAGYKPYPFVEKSPVPVKLRTPVYRVTGNMHRASDQRVWHVLEERLMFLPLTDVEIRALTNGIWSKAPFVAVNREQILSLEEEETPLLRAAGRPT